MIIGIDASRANREHKSGTEWYSYYLIRWLAKLDKRNQYILYTDRPLTDGLLDLSTVQFMPQAGKEEIYYDEHGYQVIKSPFNNFKAKILKWPYTYFWTQGRLSLEMIWHRPDILFVPAHTLPLIHPKRSIVTVHDIGFEKENRLYQREQIVKQRAKTSSLLNLLVKIFTLGKYSANTIDYLRWSTEFSLKKASQIITVSNYSKKDLEHFYSADPKKIMVIYNGYNRTLYQRVTDNNKIKEILLKYGLVQPYLLYVGRIERKKNIPALIESYAILKQKNPAIKHKLILVGDASYGYDETKYLIEDYRLDNEVIMPGWIAEEDLPSIYSGADAFVFPSVYEGFGIPLLQAMACGVPIASSFATSIPEIVSEAALLFDPYSVQSIASALKRIIADTELRTRLISSGTERIRNFSWEKCARETLAVLIDR